jgi:hypothetical protein
VASAAFARRTNALQESILNFSEDLGPASVASLDSCLSAIQQCRDTCEDFLFGRAFIGNIKLISGYRRILAKQVEAISGRIPDYSAALSALGLALLWVPKSELWRQTKLLRESSCSSLADFAEGVSGCLHGADQGAAWRAGRALAKERPTADAMDEVTTFIRQHGGELGEGFFSSMLIAAPNLNHEVFRRAPRLSRTYHRALLMISADLLAAIQVAQTKGVLSNG